MGEVSAMQAEDRAVRRLQPHDVWNHSFPSNSKQNTDFSAAASAIPNFATSAVPYGRVAYALSLTMSVFMIPSPNQSCQFLFTAAVGANIGLDSSELKDVISAPSAMSGRGSLSYNAHDVEYMPVQVVTTIFTTTEHGFGQLHMARSAIKCLFISAVWRTLGGGRYGISA